MNTLGVISCFVCFPALLAIKCVAGQWLHARASGWRRLGQRYPAGGGRPGRRFGGAAVRVGAHWYHLTPVVGVDGAGLRLAMRPPFRPFHPPVFVPWDDVTAGDLDADGRLPLRVGDRDRLTLTGPAARAVAGLVARRARGTTGQWSA